MRAQAAVAIAPLAVEPPSGADRLAEPWSGIERDRRRPLAHREALGLAARIVEQRRQAQTTEIGRRRDTRQLEDRRCEVEALDDRVARRTTGRTRRADHQ